MNTYCIDHPNKISEIKKYKTQIFNKSRFDRVKFTWECKTNIYR